MRPSLTPRHPLLTACRGRQDTKSPRSKLKSFGLRPVELFRSKQTAGAVTYVSRNELRGPAESRVNQVIEVDIISIADGIRK
jgi:hypothetical protein